MQSISFCSKVFRGSDERTVAGEGSEVCTERKVQSRPVGGILFETKRAWRGQRQSISVGV